MFNRLEVMPTVHKTPFPSPTVLATGTNNAGGASTTTASISPSANALIFAAVCTRDDTNITHSTPTTSGLTVGTWRSVTLSLQQTAGFLRWLRMTIWWNKLGASPGTGTITFGWSASAFSWAYEVCQLASGFHATDSSYLTASGSNENVGSSLATTFAATPTITSFVYTAITYDGAGTVTNPSGFTRSNELTVGSTNHELVTAFRPSNSPIAPNWTALTTGSGKTRVACSLEILRA